VGRTIGHGASCVVKMGIDTSNNSKVAIKIFKNMSKDNLKLMRNEMTDILKLQGHNNILEIIQCGEAKFTKDQYDKG